MPPATQDKTKLYAAGALGVSIILCFGFGTSLCSAFLVSSLTSGPAPRSEAPDAPVAPLELTPPGEPIKLPPLPPTIISGPPLPDSPIHRDQCSDIEHGGPVAGPGACVTSEIRCDEMIIGHTVGGVDEYDTEFYEKKFCWPRLVDKDYGNERVYKLTMPPGEWRAWATLHTPCADLDIAAVRYDHDTCPDIRSTINQCEMRPESGTRVERVEMTSQTKDGKEAIWYLIVEGKGNDEGPFSLHVQCAPGLSGSY